MSEYTTYTLSCLALACLVLSRSATSLPSSYPILPGPPECLSPPDTASSTCRYCHSFRSRLVDPESLVATPRLVRRPDGARLPAAGQLDSIFGKPISALLSSH